MGLCIPEGQDNRTVYKRLVVYFIDTVLLTTSIIHREFDPLESIPENRLSLKIGSIGHSYTISNLFRTRILNNQVTSLMSIKFVTSNEIPIIYKIASIHAVFINIEYSALDIYTVT